MIYTSQGEPVEVIGGPFRKFTDNLGLGFYIETFMVRSTSDSSWQREKPMDQLKADGGAEEIRQAAARLHE